MQGPSTSHPAMATISKQSCLQRSTHSVNSWRNKLSGAKFSTCHSLSQNFSWLPLPCRVMSSPLSLLGLPIHTQLGFPAQDPANLASETGIDCHFQHPSLGTPFLHLSTSKNLPRSLQPHGLSLSLSGDRSSCTTHADFEHTTLCWSNLSFYTICFLSPLEEETLEGSKLLSKGGQALTFLLTLLLENEPTQMHLTETCVLHTPEYPWSG